MIEDPKDVLPSESTVMARARQEIDFDSLQPGDVIHRWRLEQIIGIDYDHRLFSFFAMKISAAITVHHDEKLVTKLSQGSIRVMTDLERLSRHPAGFDRGEEKMRRENRRLRKVDTSAMRNEDAARHEKNVLRQGFVLSSLSEAKRRAQAPLRPTTKPKESPEGS